MILTFKFDGTRCFTVQITKFSVVKYPMVKYPMVKYPMVKYPMAERSRA